MKKLTHTLALSTILLGALSPTGQAIADTTPTQDANQITSQTSAPVIQAAASHVDPVIDWNNWQNRGSAAENFSVPADALVLGPSEGPGTDRSFTGEVAFTEQGIDGDTINALRFGINSIGIELDDRLHFSLYTSPGHTSDITHVSLKSLTVTNNTTGKSWNSTDIKNGPANDGTGGTTIPIVSSSADIKQLSISSGDHLTVSGVLTGISAYSTGTSILIPKYTAVVPVVTKVVKVFYKDAATGDDIAPTDVLGKGMKFGDSVTGTAKDISGYTVQGNSLVTPDTVTDGSEVNVSTTLMSGESALDPETSEGNQAIVFWYDKAPVPATPVNVKYVDENNQPIPGYDTTITGVVDGQAISTDPYKIDIPGYTLDESKLPASSVTLSTTPQDDVVFVYKKDPVPAKPVTLHYVDQDGAQIVGQEDVTLTGFNEGDTIPFADNTPAIPGYTLDTANQPDPTLTFTDTAQTFNIPYTRTQGTAVNVRYVDEKGQKIAEPTQIAGFENQTKQTDPYKIDIPGYTLDESKLPVSEVTLTTTAQPDVVFTYKQNPGSITLKYVDEQGNPISDEDGKVLEGEVDTTFTAKDHELSIPGYYLTSSPTEVTQFTSDPQTAVYKYAKDQTAIKGHDATVYVGDNWQAQDSFDYILSEDGTKTTDLIPAITVDSSQVDTTKVGDYPVTYTWTNPVTNNTVTTTVTVHVVDKSAITVHDSTLMVGDSWAAKDNFDSALNKKGDKVPFDAITVDGTVDTSKAGVYKVTYSYKEATGEVELFDAQVGDTQQGANTVIATITVKDKTPVEPGNPTEPTNPTNPSTPTNPSNPTSPSSPNSPSQTGNGQGNGNNSINQTAVSSNESLPQTGEKAGLNLVATGATLLMALIGLLLFRKPKKSSDE